MLFQITEHILGSRMDYSVIHVRRCELSAVCYIVCLEPRLYEHLSINETGMGPSQNVQFLVMRIDLNSFLLHCVQAFIAKVTTLVTSYITYATVTVFLRIFHG